MYCWVVLVLWWHTGSTTGINWYLYILYNILFVYHVHIRIQYIHLNSHAELLKVQKNMLILWFTRGLVPLSAFGSIPKENNRNMSFARWAPHRWQWHLGIKTARTPNVHQLKFGWHKFWWSNHNGNDSLWFVVVIIHFLQNPDLQLPWIDLQITLAYPGHDAWPFMTFNSQKYQKNTNHQLLPTPEHTYWYSIGTHKTSTVIQLLTIVQGWRDIRAKHKQKNCLLL